MAGGREVAGKGGKGLPVQDRGSNLNAHSIGVSASALCSMWAKYDAEEGNGSARCPLLTHTHFQG